MAPERPSLSRSVALAQARTSSTRGTSRGPPCSRPRARRSYREVGRVTPDLAAVLVPSGHANPLARPSLTGRGRRKRHRLPTPAGRGGRLERPVSCSVLADDSLTMSQRRRDGWRGVGADGGQQELITAPTLLNSDRSPQMTPRVRPAKARTVRRVPGSERSMADKPFAHAVRSAVPAGVESAPKRTPPPGEHGRALVASARAAS